MTVHGVTSARIGDVVGELIPPEEPASHALSLLPIGSLIKRSGRRTVGLTPWETSFDQNSFRGTAIYSCI